MTAARRPTTAARAAAVVVGALAAVALALVGLLATAAPAQATTYRYWTYWWGTGSGPDHTGWWFASQGPAGPVGDGWVLGWRFQTTSVSGGATPRASADFAALCPGLATPVAGSVRVALVLDFGTSSDAPPGQHPPTTASVQRACVTLPTSPTPTGARVLAAARVTVRSEGGLVCALDGYPVGECAPVVADPTPTPSRTATPSTRHASPAVTPTAARSPTPRATPTAAARTTSAPPATPAASTASPPAPGPTLPVTDVAPAASEQPTGSPAGLLVGGAVVAGVAGVAWWTARRRRTP